MRKPKPIFLTLLCVLLCAQVLPAQTQSITVIPTVAYRGQTTNFTITGTNTNFSTASSAHLYQGTTNTNYYAFPNIYGPTQIQSSFNLPTNVPLGSYDMGVIDLFSGSIYAQNAVSVVDPPGNSGIILGRVMRNTVCANGPALQGRLVEANPGSHVAITDANGYYQMFVPAGNTYTVSVSPFPVETQACPTGPLSVTVSTQGQVVSGQNFHLELAPVVDLEPILLVGIHRPGFTISNSAYVRNNGGGAAGNYTLKVILPTWVTYVSSTNGGTYANDTITWNMPGLAANGVAQFNFVVTCPTNTLGWNYSYSAMVSTTNDVDPTNDFIDVAGTVVGSYDPNDKQVWTQDGVNADGSINPSDSLLRYLVRFQNTGTDTAFNIRIHDVMDQNLDLASLEVVAASHNYQLELFNGNEVNFHFPNILLLDSNANEPLSHGFIEYRIKRKPGLPLGTVISNMADIYFDYNAPVATNTVNSKICPEAHLAFSYNQNGSNFTFTNQSTGTLGTLTWDFGDGNTSTQMSPSHNFTATGLYNVCLEMTDTCGTRSVCQVVEITQLTTVADQLQPYELKLYPNPGYGLLNLEMELPVAGPLVWRVQDLRGRTLFSADEGVVRGAWRKTLDLRSLPSGSYLIQVDQGGQRLNRMFTVR